jgi:hypothetical protein
MSANSKYFPTFQGTTDSTGMQQDLHYGLFLKEGTDAMTFADATANVTANGNVNGTNNTNMCTNNTNSTNTAINGTQTTPAANKTSHGPNEFQPAVTSIDIGSAIDASSSGSSPVSSPASSSTTSPVSTPNFKNNEIII